MAQGRRQLRVSRHPVSGRLEDIIQDLRARKAGHVAVGVIDGSGGEELRGEGITMAGLAVVHEYGAPRRGIPPRMPMTITLERKAGEIQEAQRRLGEEIMKGMPTTEALATLGEYVSSEIRASIQSGLEPPNAEATIEKKGSSKPLIDTSRLANSYTYQVRGPGEE